jgi:hypothetical protein
MTPSNELVPWAHGGDADERLRRMVRAARNDGPSEASLRAAPRAIAALLAAGAASTITTAAAGSALSTAGATALAAKNSLSSALLVKWFGVGLLAGGSVMVAANAPRFTQPAPEVPVRAPVSVVVRSPERPVPSPPRALDAPIAPATSSGPPPRASLRTELARELVLLDRARAALGAGAPQRALDALDELARLPARALAPEATVVRVRALLALGRRAEARELVEHFARRAPGSPQVAVLRALLGVENATSPPRPTGESETDGESMIRADPSGL